MRLPSPGRIAAGAAVRLLSRRIPYVGWVLTAWDLYNLYQQLKQPYAKYGPGPGAGGWQLYFDCGGGSLGPYPISGWTSCQTNYLYTSIVTALGKTITTGGYTYASYFKSYTGGPSIWSCVVGQTWRRPVSTPTPPHPKHPRWINPRPLEEPVPVRMPRLDPALIPPMTFAPDPAPIPYKFVPHRPLPPGTSRGHDRVPSLRFHQRTPPPPGTKERKLKARAAAALALKGVHVLSEALDVLDAFWNALPKNVRMRYGNATPQKKAQVIYDNYSKINMSDLMFELLWNHYSDKYIGRQFGNLDQWGRNRNITWGPYGPGGPWSPSGNAAGDLIGQVKNAAKRAWDGGEDIFAGLT